ncbi:4801_t:CDS:2 [Racocetra persica]|uniref:4801_t:CDS:1 n=1 Tax=Racocetra persica TaxID=160502 RepID=A0ACA9MPL8_9GLOM|nr:4801_t:CDS:2 [Racocetra persica]
MSRREKKIFSLKIFGRGGESHSPSFHYEIEPVIIEEGEAERKVNSLIIPEGEFCNGKFINIEVEKGYFNFKDEALFQAAKFADKSIIEKIRKAPDTGFRQPGGKKKLKEILLNAGHTKIIEDSLEDDFWGNGRDGRGKNWLGIILMTTRSILRVEKKLSGDKETTRKLNEKYGGNWQKRQLENEMIINCLDQSEGQETIRGGSSSSSLAEPLAETITKSKDSEQTPLRPETIDILPSFTIKNVDKKKESSLTEHKTPLFAPDSSEKEVSLRSSSEIEDGSPYNTTLPSPSHGKNDNSETEGGKTIPSGVPPSSLKNDDSEANTTPKTFSSPNSPVPRDETRQENNSFLLLILTLLLAVVVIGVAAVRGVFWIKNPKRTKQKFSDNNDN